jgi:hypothetical protein
MQRPTAAGAVPAVDVDHHLVARQMGGQRTVIAGRAASPRGSLARLVRDGGVLSCLVLANGLLEVFEPELQLVGAQLLGPTAKLIAAQLLDQQP